MALIAARDDAKFWAKEEAAEAKRLADAKAAADAKIRADIQANYVAKMNAKPPKFAVPPAPACTPDQKQPECDRAHAAGDACALAPPLDKQTLGSYRACVDAKMRDSANLDAAAKAIAVAKLSADRKATEAAKALADLEKFYKANPGVPK